MLSAFLLVTVLIAPYLMLLLDFAEHRDRPKLTGAIGLGVIVIGPALILYAWPSTANLGRLLMLPSIGVVICSFWVRDKLRLFVIWFDLVALNLSWLGTQLYTNQHPKAAFGDFLQEPLRVATWLVPTLVVLHLLVVMYRWIEGWKEKSAGEERL